MANIASIQEFLIGRYGKIISFAKVDVPDPKACYLDAIAAAASEIGGTLITGTTLADGHLAQMLDDQLTFHSELALIDTLLGNYAVVDTSVGGRSQSFNQIRTWLMEKRAQLVKHINNKWGSAGDSTLTPAIVVNYDSVDMEVWDYYDALDH